MWCYMKLTILTTTITRFIIKLVFIKEYPSPRSTTFAKFIMIMWKWLIKSYTLQINVKLQKMFAANDQSEITSLVSTKPFLWEPLNDIERTECGDI